jgi:hypothetical protein
MTQTERNIRTELRRALKRLGGFLPSTEGWESRRFYYALERRGASHRLLAVVGSWKDTLDDDEVLQASASAIERPT